VKKEESKKVQAWRGREKTKNRGRGSHLFVGKTRGGNECGLEKEQKGTDLRSG